jgi:hypothetical protein
VYFHDYVKYERRVELELENTESFLYLITVCLLTRGLLLLLLPYFTEQLTR